jgi:threonine/homoserine/homoserine lactone efflux protein
MLIMTSNLSVWTALLAFTGAAGLLTVVPGLDTMLVLRTAMVEGPKRAMFAGLGICTECLIWGVLVSVGLGAIFSVSNVAYHFLRIVGAGYMLYLGIRLLGQRESLRFDTTNPATVWQRKAGASRLRPRSSHQSKKSRF